MPRTSQKTIAAKPKTNTRLSKKPPLTPAQLKQVDAWWRAANYLSACQLYLLDNPLLREPTAPRAPEAAPSWATGAPCPGRTSSTPT